MDRVFGCSYVELLGVGGFVFWRVGDKVLVKRERLIEMERELCVVIVVVGDYLVGMRGRWRGGVLNVRVLGVCL